MALTLLPEIFYQTLMKIFNKPDTNLFSIYKNTKTNKKDNTLENMIEFHTHSYTKFNIPEKKVSA